MTDWQGFLNRMVFILTDIFLRSSNDRKYLVILPNNQIVHWKIVEEKMNAEWGGL